MDSDEGGSLDPVAAAEVKRSLHLGGALYLIAVLVLTLGTELSVLDSLALPAFLFLLPSLAVAQLPMVQDHELERVPAYLGSAAGIVVLGAVGLALGWRLVGPDNLGLSVPPVPSLLLWSLGLTAVGVGVMWAFHRIERARGRRGTATLRQLLPRTRRERGLFVVLSFTAGTGEELAYRGYVLVALLAAGFSPVAAAVVSSISFGFLHAYQGKLGVLTTGVLGLIFAAAVLVSGCIWPVMVAHTALDLIGGLVLGERWLQPSVADGGTER